jgi:hypothetical protein
LVAGAIALLFLSDTPSASAQTITSVPQQTKLVVGPTYKLTPAGTKSLPANGQCVSIVYTWGEDNNGVDVTTNGPITLTAPPAGANRTSTSVTVTSGKTYYVRAVMNYRIGGGAIQTTAESRGTVFVDP